MNTGNNNTIIGHLAAANGLFNAGDFNIYYGSSCGRRMTNSEFNIVLGADVLDFSTITSVWLNHSGDRNILINTWGDLRSTTVGLDTAFYQLIDNIFINSTVHAFWGGYVNPTISNSIVLQGTIGVYIQTKKVENLIAIGNGSSGGYNSISILGFQGSASDSNNVTIGYFSKNTGNNNVTFGSLARNNNNSANYHNVSLGSYSGYKLSTGNYNTFIGDSAGYKTTTGSYCLSVGSYSRIANSYNYSTAIGYNSEAKKGSNIYLVTLSEELRLRWVIQAAAHTL